MKNIISITRFEYYKNDADYNLERNILCGFEDIST